MDDRVEEWLGLVPDVQGVSVDERTESIYLDTSSEVLFDGDAPSEMPVDSSDGRAALAEFGVARAENPWAGLEVVLRQSEVIADANKGGRPLSTCTSGFTVLNERNQRLLLGAGHCRNAQNWFFFGGGQGGTLEQLGQRRNTYSDFGWWRTTQAPFPEPFFFMESTTSDVPQTGNVENLQGMYVCHRGQSSGFSCGSISDVQYRPTYQDACPGETCEARFVAVRGKSLRHKTGYSGGPWTQGALRPVGIHKAGSPGIAVYSKLGNLPSTLRLWLA